MNWENFDLHLENLIPGIVVLTVLSFGFPNMLPEIELPEGLQVTAFVGTAYMLGAVCNVFARLLLDYVCKKTIRYPTMRFFLGDRLELPGSGKGMKFREARRRTGDRYSHVIKEGLTCGNKRVESEIAKRRQTGRILRSTLVPAALLIIVLGMIANSSGLSTITEVLACYITLLVLYAYAEVVIYQESYRGEQIKRDASKQAQSRLPLAE